MRPLDPVQPIAAVLDDEHLPEPVHPYAQAWRELDALEDDALEAWRDARGKVAAAKAADRAAALEAAEKGKPAPVPANSHEAQALADIDAHAARLTTVRQRKRKAGQELLAALLEHRPALEALARDRITRATQDYTEAVDKARRSITQATAALSAATAPLGTLEELDRERRHRHEVGAHPWQVTAPDWTANQRDVKRISEAAESLAQTPVG